MNATLPITFEYKERKYLIEKNTIVPKSFHQFLKGVNTAFFKTLKLIQVTAGIILDGTKLLDLTTKDLGYLQTFVDNTKILGKINSITKFALSTSDTCFIEPPKAFKKIRRLDLKNTGNILKFVLKLIEKIFNRTIVFIKDFASLAFQWFGYLFGLKDIYVIFLGNVSVLFGGIKNGYDAFKGIYKINKCAKMLRDKKNHIFRAPTKKERLKGKFERVGESIKNFIDKTIKCTIEKIKKILQKMKILKNPGKKPLPEKLSEEELKEKYEKILKAYCIQKIIYQSIKTTAAIISILSLLVLCFGVITGLSVLSTTTFWVLGGISGFLFFAAWFFSVTITQYRLVRKHA
jgi:hypothetical protein